MFKFILTTLTSVLVLYALVLLLLYVFQERLIFAPSKLPQEYQFNFGRPFREVWIEVENAQLNALLFEHPEAKGVVLYFHDNAGALDTWGDVAEDFSILRYHH